MTKREQPWAVSHATMLALVKGATLAGFHKSVFTDHLMLRLESNHYQNGEAFLDGLALYEHYKHLCLDYQQGEDNADIRQG